jgi:hypothetical protein
MHSELSEFSYGFAITAELRDFFWPRVVEPPVFPTLRQEARLGWDVRFPVVGRSLFLQFKIADALTRSSASEWSDYNAPYYRFRLHRLSRSDQHNRLLSLARTEPFVFYVAPRFHRLDEFTEQYRRVAVCNESAWIMLSSLPQINDDLQHHITYRTGSDVRFSSPESRKVAKTFDGEGVRRYLIREFETQKKPMNIQNFDELRSTLLNLVTYPSKEQISGFGQQVDGFQLLKDIAYICRTFFGAEFLFIHERQR